MKAARHEMILGLIEKYNIETQDELARILREKGVAVTQATVSRDIKELRLIKVLLDDGKYKYATVDKAESGLKDRFNRIFMNSVISMVSCGNFIIIKTVSGTANAAAEAVDSMKWPEIAGTIAGDNTIFVAVKDAKNTIELEKRFQAMLI
ncbi:MAG: arginine repressor [Clostridia bacterium]|nr:arginine repressor [Clostridia bacterium]